MSTTFRRCKEDFDCLRCGASVAGDGYTNHCPRCLWSRHVDVNPGDRSADCGGMMEPIGLEQRRGKQLLLHRCTRCGLERRNRRSENDDFEAILQVSAKPG